VRYISRDRQLESLNLFCCFVTRSTDSPIQLGNLSLDEFWILASNGLRGRHKSIFDDYEKQIQELTNTRSTLEVADRSLISQNVHRDKQKVTQEVREIIRTLYLSVYPWVLTYLSVFYE
jgi:hypothetical protein